MFHNWLLRIFFLLPLICGRENPYYHNNDNADESKNVQIEDLIKTSPVILKALGARIFADITFDNKLKSNNNEENHVDGDNDDGDDNNYSYNKNNSNNNVDILKDTNYNNIIMSQKPTLITLTPQTVYRGASILKSTSNSRTMEGNSIDAGGEYYRYNG